MAAVERPTLVPRSRLPLLNQVSASTFVLKPIASNLRTIDILDVDHDYRNKKLSKSPMPLPSPSGTASSNSIGCF
jgi:hypothetical protein